MPIEPLYHARWTGAQVFIDDMFRAKYGMDAYVRQSFITRREGRNR